MTFSPRYFLASIALLIALVAIYAISTARRTQGELRAQMEQQGLALAEAIERSSRTAVRSNALIEETIARRLLDNARLVDELLRRPFDPADLERIASRNQLSRIELLDLQGRPWSPPPPPPGPPFGGPGLRRRMMGGADGPEAPPGAPPGGPGAMRRHMARDPDDAGPPPTDPGAMRGRGLLEGRPDAAAPPAAPREEDRGAGEPPMMRWMWGRRWMRPLEPVPESLPAIEDRQFWKGSVFGVAIGARAFPGIIAVHADADYVLAFRKDVGVERQVEELGRQSGVVSVALLGPDLGVLAASHPDGAGARRDDPALAAVATEGRPLARLVESPGGRQVFEVARPLTLDGGRAGVLAIAFSTEAMQRAWREAVRWGAILGAGVLVVGAVGLGLIFYVQQRHLRELRALEQEMARRERLAALGDVAAAFAHEVRNPLNAVSMGLQRLRGEFAAEPAAEYTRFVDLIQGEVGRLNAIVEQFIALARPLPLAPAPLAPDDLLQELAALLDEPARAAGVTVRLAVPADVPKIAADRDKLQQVLLNLALNGIQAMGRDGTLTMGVEPARDHVALVVADTGPGIPPDVLPRIFDPYFTTRPRGLGLGLTIARRIVEAHGGTLEVASRPGEGARFRVVLPRREP
jgi:signal transduction histidine kinase